MYPYREVQYIQEMRKMIKNPFYHWFLFKIKPNETVGCFGVRLEFEKKRGFHFGFIIKKEYQGIIDSAKVFAGCLIILWKMYKEKILVWYSETRTAHNTGQFGETLCGLLPIAFFPNKDIFFNKVESDFMHISYDKKVFSEFRTKISPKIIRQVLNCYSYSNNFYNLGIPIIENPKFNLDQQLLKYIEKEIVKQTEIKNKCYERVKFFLKDSNSYFNFLLNIENKSIEKVKYQVNNLEELFTFIQEVKIFIKNHNIRYCECFISAYEPSHQKIFFNANFRPTGYIPCWNYNKIRNIFEDFIVFTFYKGDIDKNLKTIPETVDLLKALNFITEEDTFIINI